MNILVITPENLPVPPVKGGSVEHCTHEVFKEMSKTHNILLLSRGNSTLPSKATIHSRYQIQRVRQSNAQKYIEEVLINTKGKTFDLIQIENRPAFVPYVRQQFPKTPIVLSLHSLTFMSKLSYFEARTILQQVDGVTSVVSFLTKRMQFLYPEFSHLFFTSMLGVDSKKFRPNSRNEKMTLRRKWKVEKTFNLLFVGRTIPEKGLDTLVRAAAIVQKHKKNIRIIVVGAPWPTKKLESPYIREVRSLSKRFEIPITFTGYIPPKKMDQMFHLGDLFICPTKFEEGFATVNSEAMASGIPVIASNRGGIPEVIIDEETGILVDDYENPEAFAESINRLIQDSAFAKKIGHQSRKWVVKNLRWKHTAMTLDKHYNRIIKSSERWRSL